MLAFIRTAGQPSRNEIVAGLKASGHAQNVVKAAIKEGIANGHVAVAEGKRGAQLHSVVTEARVPSAEQM